MRTRLSRKFYFIIINLLCLTTIQAIVIHYDTGMSTAMNVEQPHPNIVGRWSSNASCVAVAPNYIITTRHQGGGVGTTVHFDNVAYEVIEQWLAPDYIDGCPMDLRVCRIARKVDNNYIPADLTYYALPMDQTNEVDELFWMAGYGKKRGELLINQDMVYAYTWDGTSNQTQAWGQNRVDNANNYAYGSYACPLLTADFDAPNAPDATTLEAAMAEWDSGGPWIIEQGDVIKVVALGATVQQVNRSQFRSYSDPNVPQPDNMYAVRISPYYQWISGIISDSICAEQIPGDIDLDCHVDTVDLALLAKYWLMLSNNPDFNYLADFTNNGTVNLDDFAVIANHWLQCNLVEQANCFQ